MTCQSSSVAITPASAIHVAIPTRRHELHRARGRYRESQAIGDRQLTSVPPPRLRRSSAAIAMTAVRTARAPTAMASCLRAVGAVMNRVSMSTRADSPGWAGTFRSVKIPPTWGFFSEGSIPEAPGMPTNSAPAAPASAQACSTLQAPPATAGRGAAAATVSRNATTTRSLSARTNSPFLPASVPPVGRVETTKPPLAGRVAIAAHGMEMSSARGAPDTRGAVIWVTCPSVVP